MRMCAFWTSRTSALSYPCLFSVLFIVVNLYSPLRYYAQGSEYDFRFAWRMFGWESMRQCKLVLRPTKRGAPIDTHEILPHELLVLQTFLENIVITDYVPQFARLACHSLGRRSLWASFTCADMDGLQRRLVSNRRVRCTNTTVTRYFD